MLAKFFQAPPTLLLKDYTIGKEGDKTLLNINGLKTGLLAWLLDKLKISSREVNFQVQQDAILECQGGKVYNSTPMRDVYTSEIGYTNNKVLLFIAIGFCFGFIAIFPLLFAALFYWLFTKSSAIGISFVNQNGVSTGILIKSSMTGIKISKEDLDKMNEVISSATMSNSRWYNNYYKK
jgi:hypothetical protein